MPDRWEDAEVVVVREAERAAWRGKIGDLEAASAGDP